MLTATFPTKQWIGVLTLTLLLSPSAFGEDKPHPIAVQIKAELKDPAKPFTLLIRVQIKEGTQEKFETAFVGAIKGTRKEKGALAYELNRDTKDPTRYVVYERWKSLADLEVHLKTPHITTLFAELKDILAGDPEVKVLLPAGE